MKKSRGFFRRLPAISTYLILLVVLTLPVLVDASAANRLHFYGSATHNLSKNSLDRTDATSPTSTVTKKRSVDCVAISLNSRSTQHDFQLDANPNFRPLLNRTTTLVKKILEHESKTSQIRDVIKTLRLKSTLSLT